MSGLTRSRPPARKPLKVKSVRVNYANHQHQTADVLPDGQLDCELCDEHGTVFTAGESTIPDLISALKDEIAKPDPDGWILSVQITVGSRKQEYHLKEGQFTLKKAKKTTVFSQDRLCEAIQNLVT
jgi:hypothetical protein